MHRHFVRLALFTLIGMVIGYLLMHPLAMLALVLGPHHSHASLNFFLLGSQQTTAIAGSARERPLAKAANAH